MGTQTASTAVLGRTERPVSFDGLGIPSREGVEVHVVRQADGWRPVEENKPLSALGNMFVGYPLLAPGEAFLILITGLNPKEAGEIFEDRRRNGLVHDREGFLFSRRDGAQGLLLCIVGNDRFPVDTNRMRHPANIVDPRRLSWSRPAPPCTP